MRVGMSHACRAARVFLAVKQRRCVWAIADFERRHGSAKIEPPANCDIRSGFSALSLSRVGQVGPLITGCTTEQVEAITTLPTFYTDYRVHFSPESATQTLKNGKQQHYMEFNKPFGLLHFLDHGEPKDNLHVALVDADYMLL
ncbi:Aste57867_18226 [Aphanomyces stellatus]|uniref:Aste57867_18226 protein n=1 Tax=Aphanomyces stellatus TaxID=120398 RepID=A0A485L9H7_9STRA|nr:hypothetical protein As57867_018164 [Aphanomyces stellatus]VFT94964.1 Aste57867_18226 [Aphanomyces stellatus]